MHIFIHCLTVRFYGVLPRYIDHHGATFNADMHRVFLALALTLTFI